MPQHIVLFPDGNRRWARAHGVSTLEGHLRGREKFEEFLRWCHEAGVRAVTVFGFSTENWNRPPEEVAYLMALFERYFGDRSKVAELKNAGVRVTVLGQRERLSPKLQQVIARVEEETRDNTAFFLNPAVSYGGKWDIIQAVRQLMAEGKGPDEITEEAVASKLSMAGQPDPDLVIRASGEHRFSNFVIWQAAYAELYFCPILWPDFRREDFDEALAEFQRRHRRFGR